MLQRICEDKPQFPICKTEVNMFLPGGAENRNKLLAITCMVTTVMRVVQILTHWKSSENCYSLVTSYSRPFKNSLLVFSGAAFNQVLLVLKKYQASLAATSISWIISPGALTSTWWSSWGLGQAAVACKRYLFGYYKCASSFYAIPDHQVTQQSDLLSCVFSASNFSWLLSSCLLTLPHQIPFSLETL